VRRLGFIATTICALGVAGALAASVTASGAGPQQTTTVQTTTTAPAATLPPGVTIGGVAVGGMTPEAAIAAVQDAFATPLRLVVAGHKLAPSPAQLGAEIQAQKAVEQAQAAQPGTAIQVVVTVRLDGVRAYVARVADRFDRPAADSQLFLRHLRPYITRGHSGLIVARVAAAKAIESALLQNRRATLVLPTKKTKQRIKRGDFGPVIVIHRGTNRLFLYAGMRSWRVFGVATGQNRYPTPLGRFRIVVMWRNPWWYPPASPWAAGQKPIPPGPGNPLGTRWMGLSSPGVGIHGTYVDGSIGYSVSHGCIRMHIPDAEWLFKHVTVGTPVFIVAA
jgi:lipoprotein-anchoring transpeptidase ErfK/SrfK